MGFAWFIYRKMELRYWLVPGNVKKFRLNFQRRRDHDKAPKLRMLDSVVRLVDCMIQLTEGRVNLEKI